MISVVVCSIDPAKFTAVKAMLDMAFGNEPWELLGIHDAHSLAEAYNGAVATSKGELIVFCHDDIQIFSPGLPGKLKTHLSRFDLVGVAGTDRLVSPRWSSAGPPHIFGQVVHVHEGGKLVVDMYGVPRPVIGNIQALDGVFLAARRDLFQTISFDAATFDGFHLYDIDFSYQAFLAGRKLAVACDIHLTHQSAGNYDQSWQLYAERFQAKWQKCIPFLPPPPSQWLATQAESLEHASELMTPGYWSLD